LRNVRKDRDYQGNGEKAPSGVYINIKIVNKNEREEHDI